MEHSPPFRIKISVIVPTKDRLALLKETVASVRAQTYPHWELIIVDDDSHDGTPESARRWVDEDGRIHFISRSGSPVGGNRCRNLGIDASTGEYVIFLDSDDCLAPSCLSNRVLYVQANPGLDFAVFGCRLFRLVPGDTDLLYNCHVGQPDLIRFLEWDNPWGPTCPIWKRETLKSLKWDEALPSLQDWDFHLRALSERLRYEKVPEADWFYRMPSEQRPSTSRKLSSREHMPAHDRLLDNLHGLLRDRGLLRPEMAVPLAGVHFHLAVCCAARGQLDDAVRFWHACHDRGLITRLQHVEGILYLRVFPHRLARRAMNLYLAARWPSTLRKKYSATRFITRSLTASVL